MVLTPIKAIRKKCLDCVGNQYKTVRLCEDKKCPLHPYRMGRRPKDGSSLYYSSDEMSERNET